MLNLYKNLVFLGTPILHLILNYRRSIGKEHQKRFQEKKGKPSEKRPSNDLVWLHAASVGEIQSAISVINKLKEQKTDTAILVTTGTITSAQLIKEKLGDQIIHQFYPLDHPTWVGNFLDHWKPNSILWLESEIWPNMLAQIKQRQIPTALINARLSDRSFARWTKFPLTAENTISAFDKILCQTETDRARFTSLSPHTNVQVTGNIKYSASPLSREQDKLQILKNATQGRPIWLYASTHSSEEKIASDIHQKLKKDIKGLLTIVVPRHPDRGENIYDTLKKQYDLNICRRGPSHEIPSQNDDIYIADTLGELGLFYDIAPIACIGRSFSDDGGGGHNPIEAAQLNCAILHGPNVQNLQDIFNEMHEANAAIQCETPEELHANLLKLFANNDFLKQYQDAASTFAKSKTDVIDRVMNEITPLLD